MSSAIGGFVAQVVFWALLAYGRAFDEIGWKRTAAFVALWVGGFFGLPHVPYAPARDMFLSYVAVLDVVLVFLIFRGDIRIT